MYPNTFILEIFPMIIDIHQHVNVSGKWESDLIKFLDINKTDKCWLLSWECMDGGLIQGYKHLSIAEVEKAWKMYPKRIIPFAGVDPRRDDAEDKLAAYRKKGFCGYGEIKIPIPVDSPPMVKMLRLAGKLKMPVILHLDPVINNNPYYLGDIGNLENAARLCPDTILFGHAPGFWREISGDADKDSSIYPTGRVTQGGRLFKVLEKYPNIWCDLSAGSCLKALKRDLKVTQKLLTKFRKRICFGSDEYSTEKKDFLMTLKLPTEVLADIMGNNATRLLKKH
jgi:predicted TIM-barrel fold metal-dependent hydrolase